MFPWVYKKRGGRRGEKGNSQLSCKSQEDAEGADTKKGANLDFVCNAGERHQSRSMTRRQMQ